MLGPSFISQTAGNRAEIKAQFRRRAAAVPN